MKIIAHRGYWKNECEKNTLESFSRALAMGFGIETDVRDYNGDLVISHNIPSDKNIKAIDMFNLYSKVKSSSVLAVNIKSDGLQQKLKQLLIEFGIKNYFVFDMSVPDFKGYIGSNFNCFTRQSEYELTPSFYEQSSCIWLDEFEGHWIDRKTIKHHWNSGKQICMVSPELHQRNYLKEWILYKEIELNENIELMICTDFPEKARRFFNE